MDKQQALLVDRALAQLADPALRESKSARRAEKLLSGSRKSGDLSPDDLRRVTVDLVGELDIPKYFAKGGTDEDTTNSGLAILFLLILLSLLLALAGDSDTGSLIEELIQALLDLLRGGS